MLLVSKRCGESVYSVRYSVCFAARFPTFPVHAACPPSLVCERSVRGGLFRGLSSCTITLIFTFAYLRQPWIYDLTFSFDCDIDCICTFEIDLVNTHQFGYSQARFLCGAVKCISFPPLLLLCQAHVLDNKPSMEAFMSLG